MKSLLLFKNMSLIMVNKSDGHWSCPKYMNFVDSHLSEPPLPSFSQFISGLYNHELRVVLPKNRRLLITIWHSIHKKSQAKEDVVVNGNKQIQF